MLRVNFIVILFVSSFIFAQTTSSLVTDNVFSLKIESGEISSSDISNGKMILRNYLEFADYSKSDHFKLPEKNIIIAIPPNAKISVYFYPEITVTYENTIPNLNPSLFRQNDSLLVEKYSENLHENKIFENESVASVKAYFWLRDFYCVAIRIKTHMFDPAINEIVEIQKGDLVVSLEGGDPILENQPLQIKSMYDNDLKRILYNWDIAEQFRSNASFPIVDNTGKWINYSQTYLKIVSTGDGVFRIQKDDLDNLEINTAVIDPRTFQLFESGIEQPIFVAGELDGTFDTLDYIEFFGQKNYTGKHRIINNDDEEYNEYLNRYSDSTYFFLTWGSTNGKRCFIQTEYNNTIDDTLDYFNSLLHYEDNTMFQFLDTDELANQMPNWNKNKAWYWQWVFTSPRNFNFTITDLYPNKTAKLFFKLTSAGSSIATNSHIITMSMNNVVLDSQVVNRYDQVLLQNQVNSSSLINGTNTIRITNFANGTSPNFFGVDWYEVSYPKKLNMTEDVLYFSINDETFANGERLISVNEIISPDINLYKVLPTFKKMENFLVAGNTLYFTDTVNNNDAYCIFYSNSFLTPHYKYVKKFDNLRNNDYQTDYIAICPSTFRDVSEEYTEEISNLFNITTSVFEVDAIFDEFNYGYPSPESIRLFLARSYENWNSPKPSYLVIIGDANYDYKRYRLNNAGIQGGGNHVLSYGVPVSDNWFSVWDEEAPVIPQLKVGRIPINDSSELTYYLSKVTNNEESSFSDWNKKYIFFSGGNGSDPNELSLLKSVNDKIITDFIEQRPVSGRYNHFYKTIEPTTNFGSLPIEDFLQLIAEGGLFISYIGHSGTATWDNGINTTSQLWNTIDRNPLITDFGCSTNKFAEPDIISFSERFVLDESGQAIAYIGNSSLGFQSTATTVPNYFYQSLFEDPFNEVGSAHIRSKSIMFDMLGMTNANKIFALTNTIIGDPIVQIKIPSKPNLIMTDNDVFIEEENVYENTDSVEVKILIKNLGLAPQDSFKVKCFHLFQNEIVNESTIIASLPEYVDTLKLVIKIGGMPGEHQLTVALDSDNELEEIYEDDNEMIFTFNVYSSAIRDLVSYEMENSTISEMILLNPSINDVESNDIHLQLSNSFDFSNPQELYFPLEEYYSKIELPILNENQRYWLRCKINSDDQQFSQIKSFVSTGNNKFYLTDSVSFCNQELSNVKFSDEALIIDKDTVTISVLSAGWYVGSTCVISKNSENLLNNNFFAGMAIVVLNPVTLEVEDANWYQLFANAANAQALTDYINSIANGKIVVMGAADDAKHRLSTDLKNAIKTLGSTKIDQLVFRGSWAIIGRKGAVPGDVLEDVKDPNDELVFLDTTFVINSPNGNMKTVILGPSSNWSKIVVNHNLPGNSYIDYKLIGIHKDGTIDSLQSINIDTNEADLSNIDAKAYPKLKLDAELHAASDGISPSIISLSIDYTGVPELGTNYQVAWIDQDTLEQGEDANLSFYVYNVGESVADSFKVQVDIVNPDNTREKIFETIVDSLGIEQRKLFDVNYNTASVSGAKSFFISIDSGNDILELFEDNNYYTIPFYVQADTTRPTLNLTFDGIEIFDGDFISPEPVITVELSDESLLGITDTSAVEVYLNNQPVYYSQNIGIMNYSFAPTNPKFTLEYRPQLDDGEYILKVIGRDAVGNLVDSSGITKSFVVENDAKLLYVYNYPNPFVDDTYFTFKLTQIPDELKIKIYTIAGRLIREIKYPSADLNIDFNRIYWDGRDEDGDLIANGVYLYKVFMTKDGRTETVTQKLAVVR